MSSVKCGVLRVEWRVGRVKCEVCSAECEVSGVKCGVCIFKVWSVKRSAQCQVESVKWRV